MCGAEGSSASRPASALPRVLFLSKDRNSTQLLSVAWNGCCDAWAREKIEARTSSRLIKTINRGLDGEIFLPENIIKDYNDR